MKPALIVTVNDDQLVALHEAHDLIERLELALDVKTDHILPELEQILRQCHEGQNQNHSRKVHFEWADDQRDMAHLADWADIERKRRKEDRG